MQPNPTTHQVSIRDATQDAVIVDGMYASSALIAVWIVNRM